MKSTGVLTLSAHQLSLPSSTELQSMKTLRRHCNTVHKIEHCSYVCCSRQYGIAMLIDRQYGIADRQYGTILIDVWD